MGKGGIPMKQRNETPHAPLNRANIQTFVIDACGGEPEIALEMVDFFLESANKLTAEIETQLAADNMPEARRAAHSLKSGSRMFGDETLADLCLRAEKSAEENDRATVSALLPQIQLAVAWLGDELPVIFREMLAQRS